MIKILPEMSTSELLEMGRPGGGVGPGIGRQDRADTKQQLQRKRRSEEVEPTVSPVKRSRRPSGSKRIRRRKRGGGGGSAGSSASALLPAVNAAPLNSTQFLMSDVHHEDTQQYLDSALNPSTGKSGPPGSERTEANAAAAVAKRKGTRARESSFSLDSDEDYYYSSPEDEEEFVCQEFIKEYNSVRTGRLVDMNKSDLIQEYLQMEQRVDSLEKRLNRRNEVVQDESCKETADQIRHYQREILRLEAENEKLRTANVALASSQHQSEDDSCSTCSSSSSSSSEESDDETEDDAKRVQENAPEGAKEEEKEDKETDTGYESSNSGSNKVKTEATSSTNQV